MDQTLRHTSLKQLLLRGLRIAASTVALVELLRNDWTGGLATLAWFCSRRWSVVKASAVMTEHSDPSGSAFAEAPFEGNPAAICTLEHGCPKC